MKKNGTSIQNGSPSEFCILAQINFDLKNILKHKYTNFKDAE